MMLSVSIFIALSGTISFILLIKIIGFTYLYKIIFALVAAPFVVIIASFLKKKEGVDAYDYYINFNPLEFFTRSKHLK
jgi:uncharacterized PurR-regulated membrane protein YhhQ (DUF165 family)